MVVAPIIVKLCEVKSIEVRNETLNILVTPSIRKVNGCDRLVLTVTDVPQ